MANKQLFLNNAKTTILASVNAAPSTGTPATELDYGILRINNSLSGLLTNPTGGDYYIATLFKLAGTTESYREIVKITAVDYSTPGECRITVLRGQEGSTIRAYVAGDNIGVRLTAGGAGNLLQRTGDEMTGPLTVPTVLAGGLTTAMTNAGAVQARGGVSGIAASAAASVEVKAIAHDWFAGSYCGSTLRYNGASAAGNLPWLAVAKANMAEVDYTNCAGLVIGSNQTTWVKFAFGGTLGLTITPNGIEQQSVLAPTLINTWANSGGSYADAGYWKDPNGNVHLRGAVTGGTAGSVAFVLPAGYRPALTAMFPGIGNSAATNTYVAVDSAGNVTLGAVGRMHLDGIIFRAA